MNKTCVKSKICSITLLNHILNVVMNNTTENNKCIAVNNADIGIGTLFQVIEVQCLSHDYIVRPL